ncbi:MAG TPA: sugar phosphate isomerase/epimerase [Planctomycetes bacterium]|nr:sugar phosphate isomerase/epimerase [Planctomycetota bacterium]
MKYGVFTVILPELDLDETIAEVAAAGYGGIEWRCREIPADKTDAPYSYWGNVKNDMSPVRVIRDGREIAGKCKAAGLQCFALASYCNVLHEKDVREAAEAAAAIGARYFRVGPPHYGGDINYNKLFTKAVKAYEKAVKTAQKCKVSVAIETHMGNITPSAGLVHRIVANFAPREIGVIYDPGNMVTEGYENYQMGLEQLGKYLRHVHVKNQMWRMVETLSDGTDRWAVENSPLKKGCVDWRRVVRALRSVGFDGYLSIEDFSNTPWKQKLNENIAYLKSVVAEVDGI